MPDDHHPSGMIPAARPSFSAADIAEILPAVEAVLRSGRLILGEQTLAFEDAFRQYVGTAHAVAVNSCSTAIQIVLRHFGAAGREVIVPTNTFPGVVSCVLYEGGIPVLADMNPATFCIDAEDALRRVTPRTAGMIIVHLGGLVDPEVDHLREACRQRGLFLIEDAAHAHGAAIDGRRAGSLADAGCFSFYPTKIMTTATGGMITTDQPELAEYARKVRHHGQGRRREDFDQMGNDWCLSEIHALLGLRQLAGLEASVAHRNQLVTWYREGLGDADWITIPTHPGRFRHAYYKLPTIVAENVDRDLLRRTLEEQYGIQNGTIYDPPCHLQKAFHGKLRLPRGTFPNAERTLARQLCPPVHAGVTREDVQRVIGAMREVIDRCRLAPGTRRG